MDVNKDGVVSWDDFDQMITRFNTVGLLQESEKQSFEDAIKVWEEFLYFYRYSFFTFTFTILYKFRSIFLLHFDSKFRLIKNYLHFVCIYK